VNIETLCAFVMGAYSLTSTRCKQVFFGQSI